MGLLRSVINSLKSNPKLTRNLILAAFVLVLPLTVFVAQQAQDRRQQAEDIVGPTASPTPPLTGAIYKISGSVYNDVNNDSLKQTGEGMLNVPVTITNEQDQLILSLVTDTDGTYQAMLTDPGAYLVNAGAISGTEYKTPNPKLVTVGGVCPTPTPLPTLTPTPEPTATTAPTATSVPTATPTLIPSPTTIPSPTLTLDENNATDSGNVQSAQDATTCTFEYKIDFKVASKPSATSIPTPTVDACMVGLTSINVNTYCGNNQYRYVEFRCANGAEGKLGGPTTCKTMDSWYGYARNSCQRQSSCPVTPTKRPTATPLVTSGPTVTPLPTATLMPTATPIPTATPFPRSACDVNINGKIGQDDFFAILNCYRDGKCRERREERADINNDARVNFTDLNVFIRECSRL